MAAVATVQSYNHAWRKSVAQTPNCVREYNGTAFMVSVGFHAAPPLDSVEWERLQHRIKTDATHGVMLPEVKPLQCNETFRLAMPTDHVRAIAKRASLAFGFLLRDAEPYLERNLMALADLCGDFATCWLFFVENDSRDRTRLLLQRRMAVAPSAGTPLLRGSFLTNISRAYSVALCPPGLLQRNCAARVQLLGFLRQRVLNLAWEQSGWDALVMLDFDFVTFASGDFLQMFALGVRLNASAIVGVSMYRNKLGHCTQYDRSLLGSNFKSLTRTMVHQGCMGTLLSGHGGFPVFFAQALRSAEPRPGYANQKLFKLTAGGGYNDLVPFNLALGKHGRAVGMPFLVDPRFRPLYTYGEGDLYLKNVSLALAMMSESSSTSPR